LWWAVRHSAFNIASGYLAPHSLLICYAEAASTHFGVAVNDTQRVAKRVMLGKVSKLCDCLLVRLVEATYRQAAAGNVGFLLIVVPESVHEVENGTGRRRAGKPLHPSVLDVILDLFIGVGILLAVFVIGVALDVQKAAHARLFGHRACLLTFIEISCTLIFWRTAGSHTHP
jgi:hypothetical protein